MKCPMDIKNGLRDELVDPTVFEETSCGWSGQIWFTGLLINLECTEWSCRDAGMTILTYIYDYKTKFLSRKS